MIRLLNEQFSRITDWLLICIGVALMIKAVLAVDVAPAKYGIIVIGALLAGMGFWYRHRRKRRRR